MAKAARQLFEYAIILQEKTDSKGNVTEEAKVLVSPTTILAKDVQEAQIHVSRAIPDEYLGDLERVTLVVRPF